MGIRTVGIRNRTSAPGYKFKVSATALAVRAALAASAAILALGGSGVALAGTCTLSATNTVSCNGVFTDSVDNSINPVDVVPDLTLVIGDTSATTVDPAVGVDGLDANWGGDVTVITYADITTNGADGINQYGSDTANLYNYGAITTYVSGYGDNAVDISGYYGVTMVNGGDILAYSANGSPVVTVYAYSESGDVNIDNQANGTITAIAEYQYATAVYAYSSNGSVTINNDGLISATSYYASAVGIEVDADGNVDITNAGTIEADSGTYGALGIQVFAYGDVTVDNSGTITADDPDFFAGGVQVFSFDSSAEVDNSGTITATSGGTAVGVGVYAYYALVDNSGTITATAYGNAYGVHVEGYTDATVLNSGSIGAYAEYGSALGVLAYGEYITVDNSGSIVADGYYSAYGIVTIADYGTTVYNSGSVAAYSHGYDATVLGIFAEAYYDGDASVDSSGSVTAAADYGDVAGVFALSKYGAASVDNSGDIDVSANTDVDYFAIGASARAYYDATINNSGSVTVDGYVAIGLYSGSFEGTAVVITAAGSSIDVTGVDFAVGIQALSGADGFYVYNAGDIDVSSSGAYLGDSTAMGIRTGGTGDALVYNSGDITVTASGYTSDVVAFGIYAATYAGDVLVESSGNIDVTATGYAYSVLDATGIYAVTTDGDVSVTSSGGVVVTTEGYGQVYTSHAIGIYAQTSDGNVYVGNSGDMYVISDYSYATGIHAESGYLGDTAVDNSGLVAAFGYYDAIGIEATTSGDGDVAVDSSGSIYVRSYHSDATGISAYAYYGSIAIDNSGDIDVAGYGTVIGMYADSAGDGDIYVGNSGTVTVESYDSDAYGILAFAHGDGDIDIDSSGSIDATAYDAAFGIYAYAEGAGSITVANSGDISASSDTYAVGIYTYTEGEGDNSVDNSGSIDIDGGDYADGIRVNTNGYYGGDIFIDNSGSITVTADTGSAYGIYADANGDGADINIDNSGSIVVDGSGYGIGIKADLDNYAAIAIDNSGSVTAYSDYTAIGIGATTDEYTDYGIVAVDNSGSVNAASLYGQAVGIEVRAPADYYYGGANYTDLAVDNSGSVYAYSAYDNATGILVGAYGDGGSISIDNSGSVNAVAYDTAVGVRAYVFGDYGQVSIGNAGDVSASAEGADDVYAAGILVSYVYSLDIAQDGSVSATATGVDYARATGVSAGGTYVDFAAGTDSSTTADASAGYYAKATGIDLFGPYLSVYSDGAISATALADGEFGEGYAEGVSAVGGSVELGFGANSVVYAGSSGFYAYATGVFASGEELAFDNAGAIDAYVTGDFGRAAGAILRGYYDLIVYNSGDIHASFSGGGTAVGLYAHSWIGDVAVYNDGLISAEADGVAVGLAIYTDDFGSIVNSGTIEAYGGDAGIAIWSYGLSSDIIYNYGTITGSMLMGDGADFFGNLEDGIWNASGYSDFGAGDDSIVNYGTINMSSATIAMGTYSSGGNFFANHGTINLSGSNFIDMGGPETLLAKTTMVALVPSANPNAFYNYGVLDFQDGDPDDSLTITGDFGGDGDINVDVSGLNGTSDQLYIDGSVDPGSVSTINVDLLDFPPDFEDQIPIVYVSGDSSGSNFVLGVVAFDEDHSFVTLDFSLIPIIDGSNVHPDTFSLGIQVPGLTDSGTISAVTAPAVLGLMQAQVGSLTQRLVAIDQEGKHGVSLWARVFTNSGSVEPDHGASNFGSGGNFGFDQRNSGVEAGVDFAIGDEFMVGALLAQTRSNQDLVGAGQASSDVDANTWGIYGTWVSSTNGLYFDASYRWMSFDAKSNSVAGVLKSDGDATSLNLEMGYAWTLSGDLKVEPQLQYTRTSVDNLDVSNSSTSGFESDGAESSRLRAGVMLRKTFAMSEGGTIWTPYASISAVREFDGKSEFAILGTFLGETDVSGTSVLVEAGVNAQIGLLSVFAGVNWQDGGALQNFLGGQIGIRYSW